MPEKINNIRVICRNKYFGYGKFYCSAKCQMSDKSLKERIVNNRTGKRKPHTDATKDKIRRSIVRWHKEIGISNETREKHSKNGKGAMNPNWKGGEIKMGDYWYIWAPYHCRSNIRGYVKKAIIVAENILNSFISGEEAIHHSNSRKDDDSPTNLYLFPTENAHRSFHAIFQGRGHKGEIPPVPESSISVKE